MFASVVSFGGSPFELLCIVCLLACMWYWSEKGKECIYCFGCELSCHAVRPLSVIKNKLICEVLIQPCKKEFLIVIMCIYS